MRRDWVRAFKRQGLKLLIMPLVVLGLMLFVFYQYVDEYVGHRDEALDLVSRLEVMETTSSLSKKIEVHNTLLRSEYLSIQQRAYRLESFDASLEAMKSNVTEMLQSLFFENVQVSKTNSPPNAGAMRLAVNAEFSGVPQQLPRLESLLLSNQKAARLSELQIKVADDVASGGSRLEISARLLAVHVAPDPIEKVKQLPLPR